MAHKGFRLESVLKLRAAERDARRQQLAEAFHADQVLQEHQQLLQDELVEMKDRLRTSSSPGTVDVNGLLDVNRYDLVLAARRQQLDQQRLQLAAEIERRRAALIEADRQVQVLEKLKERQVQAQRKSDEMKEIKQADELAQRRTVERIRQS